MKVVAQYIGTWHFSCSEILSRSRCSGKCLFCFLFFLLCNFVQGIFLLIFLCNIRLAQQYPGSILFLSTIVYPWKMQFLNILYSNSILPNIAENQHQSATFSLHMQQHRNLFAFVVVPAPLICCQK